MKVHRLNPRRGQSMVEYMVLIAVLSVLTFGLSSFLSKAIFGDGLKQLPQNMTPLMSSPKGG